MTRRRLPLALDDLRGLRAALWVRESTQGQYDNFGPDAQREQYAQALDRWGLGDSGVSWTVAHSGWKIARHPAWAEMLGQAGDTFDVLVVGYASRFARSLEAHVDARRAFHAAGAAILFVDERVLTSDEDAWERWAREAVEAESYSRKLSRRVKEGYAAKRRREGVPGGNRPPYGLLRQGRRPTRLEPDPETFPTLQRVYELAAEGRSDRDVSRETGLARTHVAEILTNPVYAGRLHRGEDAGGGPFVDPAAWDTIQALRARYSRRHPGATTRRRYALSSLLFCAACRRRLTGHSGRYRHVDACEAFVAAAVRRPRAFKNGQLDGRTRGESYLIAAYEDPLGRLLGKVALAARVKVETVGMLTDGQQTPDSFTLARIARDRETATSRYLRDRDMRALEAAMRRLDDEETRTRERVPDGPTAAESRAWLDDMARLWVDTDDEGRRAIADAMFERVDVLGVTSVQLTPTPAAYAHGFAAAFGRGPIRIPLEAVSGSIGQYGRGERI